MTGIKFDRVERPKLTADPNLHHPDDGRPEPRKIYLGRVEIHEVLKAHVEEGWVEIFYKENGRRVRSEDGDFVTKIIHGEVTVELPEPK